MDQNQVEPEASHESVVPAPPTRVGRLVGFMRHHPKTSLVVGAGISFMAGAELLAAALVGGAVVLAFRGRGNGVKEGP